MQLFITFPCTVQFLLLFSLPKFTKITNSVPKKEYSLQLKQSYISRQRNVFSLPLKKQFFLMCDNKDDLGEFNGFISILLKY